MRLVLLSVQVVLYDIRIQFSQSHIVSAIDKGHVVELALLDLSSAFDTDDHTLLLSILENRFSVTGTSFEWFRSYLTDRTQIFTAG